MSIEINLHKCTFLFPGFSWVHSYLLIIKKKISVLGKKPTQVLEYTTKTSEAGCSINF